MDRRLPVVGLLRDVESRLPPGFRFHPTDVELISYYLRAKVVANNQQTTQQQPPATTMVVEVDLHEREPWELPVAAKVRGNEWYFFSYRDRKYATGSRTNRATKLGYWKATGKDKLIHHHQDETMVVIGTRKTLVFYFGRAPNGRKSGWVMHEFRLADHTSHHANPPPPQEDWVLCRVFHKGEGENEQQGTTIGPGASWPAARLCPPPAPQQQQPAAAADNLIDHRRQFLEMMDSSSKQLLVDAMAAPHHPAATTLLQQAQHTTTTTSSNFDFSDCLAAGDEISLAGCGGNCTAEMVLLQDGSYDHDGVYYF